MPERYVKKPLVIEAARLTDENMWAIYDWIGTVDEWCWDDTEKYIVIRTLEGRVTARENDWVIRGIDGEFYPCRSDIFEATYERAMIEGDRR